jgi:hypothetical protein
MISFSKYYKLKLQESIDSIDNDNLGLIKNFIAVILSNSENRNVVLSKLQELSSQDKTGKSSEILQKINWDSAVKEAGELVANDFNNGSSGKDNADHMSNIIKPAASDMSTSGDVGGDGE